MPLTHPIPLTLYIHLPWCVRKCPYCDFNSHTAPQELPEAAYIAQLCADLEQDLPKVFGRRLTSIFIGGGTPSLFSPASIEQLLNRIRAYLPFGPDIEITLEANPGSVERARFAEFRSAGINRLSIGVQSFQDDKLKSLGRIHDSQCAKLAAETASIAGFSNFNLDLMFGLPHQSVDDALSDLQTAVSLKPTHLSWYHLTLEPNTLFHHKPPPLPHDEIIWKMQERGQSFLATAGFKQYEVSAYSQANRECDHNLNYWEFGDYLGIGAGAHAKLTDVSEQTITRYWKLKNPKDYLQAKNNFIGGEKIIAQNELAFEFMLNALRLCRKIPVSLFEERTGLALSTIEDALNKAHAKKLLHWNEQHIQLTDLGMRFLNDVLTLFMR
jgi:putative oxygen-independent coproporphyrinogen III oxidase